MTLLQAIICAALRHTRGIRLGRSVAYRYGEYLAWRGNHLVGRVPTGSQIVLSPVDHQHRAIFIYGEYEPEVTALLARLIKPGSVFFDIGANAGFFSLLARDLGADVHAFEPNPGVRELLEESAGWNDKRLTINRQAVSRTSGSTAKLYIADPRSTGMSSLERVTDDVIEVETITLDDYVVTKGAIPHLIKVDVEGHQQGVLEGARHLFSSHRPSLVVEARMPQQVAELTALGYEPSRILPDGSTRRLDWHELDGTANLFFSRSPESGRIDH